MVDIGMLHFTLLTAIPVPTLTVWIRLRGGKIYQVLREPTLSLHPTSLLTQMAEEQKDDKAIFVEGSSGVDGCFQVCHIVLMEAMRQIFFLKFQYLRFEF